MGIGSLFDAGPRYGGPSLYSESQFAFLNRAVGAPWQRVRDVLEDWYRYHPDPDGDLRARFRQHDIAQHATAWWELYTYTLFRRLGCTLTVHPTIRGTRRPDFLVTRHDCQMYVECVVLFDDHNKQSTDSEAWLKDCIDAARNPDFMVDISFISGTRRPKKRDVTLQIETWLTSLDYDEVRAQDAELPSQTFDFGGCSTRLTALPVHPDSRGEVDGRIGIGPASSAWVIKSAQAIRDLLDKKARQCKEVDAPFVVAVLNWASFPTLREMADPAFGSTGVQYELHDSNSVRGIRYTDGYWHPGPPPRGSRVSAVMFAEHLHPSRVVAELPSMWLNPWANDPLHTGFPFETHTAHDTGEVFLAREASTSPDVLFDLPSDWPGFAAG
jgi:hypothetical protein